MSTVINSHLRKMVLKFEKKPANRGLIRFVCFTFVDALCPSQQFFSQVGTFLVLNQY